MTRRPAPSDIAGSDIATAPLDTEPERCECGQPLVDHPPLTLPKPLASWKSQRETERAQSKASSRLRW